MNQFAQKNNYFWSKIPHRIHSHWCGSRPSFLAIVTSLSERVNDDGEIHFSARKLSNEVGVNVSNVSRFLKKGAEMGLWIYKFDTSRNLSFLKLVGGIFANIYTQAQHVVKLAKSLKDRVFPRRKNPIAWSATPPQHLPQHPSNPLIRVRNLGLLASIREASIAIANSNATPTATQI